MRPIDGRLLNVESFADEIVAAVDESLQLGTDTLEINWRGIIQQ